MEQSKKNRILADLVLIGVAFVWGSGFVSSKTAIAYMSPMMLMAFRFTIATIISALVFRKNLKSISKETLKAGFIIGLFLFLAFSAQMVGIQYVEAGKQAFLTATNVIMVPFIYWAVKKKKPDKYNFIAAFIMFLGLALLTIDFATGFSFNPGDTLTLLCAFLFACHIVSIGAFAGKHDTIALTVIQLAVASIFSLVYVIFSGEILNFTFSQTGLLNAAYLGIFCTFLAFLGQTMAQKHTNSTHTAIILSLESVFGSFLSILILNENFTFLMFIGCLIIFIGILTAETKWSFLRKKRPALLELEESNP